MAAASMACRRPIASWGTAQTPTPKPSYSILSHKWKPIHVSPLSTSQATAPTATAQVRTATPPPSRLRNPKPPRRKKEAEVYLGYERWSPAAPNVDKFKSTYNAASLAFLGDCIYELYARRHFLYPPLSIDMYNERVTSIVRCESQDALLKKLLQEDYLTKDERDILRWGRNIGSNKTRTRKRAGLAVYSSASSLETLIGHLYLTNVKRLEELMYKLGFSTDASAERIIEKKV